MKLKIFLLLPIVLFLTFIGHAQVVGSTLEEANSTNKANLIFAYNNVYGLTQQKDGNVEGLLVDLMEAFERYVELRTDIVFSHKFVYTNNDFSQFLSTVKKGKGGVFGLGNVSITESRKKEFVMSVPYIENVSLIVTHNNKANISNMDQLAAEFAGKVGYTISNTTYEARMKQIKADYLPDLNITYFKAGSQLTDELSKNKDAFAVMDLNFYLEALNKRKPLKRHPAFDEKGDSFGIIMPKNSDWGELLDEFLSSGFLKSSEYRQILIKNLGNSARMLLE